MKIIPKTPDKQAKKSTPTKAMFKRTVDIVTFDDWETWSPVDGCTVLTLTERQFRSLERGGNYPKNLRVRQEQVRNLREMLEQVRGT